PRLDLDARGIAAERVRDLEVQLLIQETPRLLLGGEGAPRRAEQGRGELLLEAAGREGDRNGSARTPEPYDHGGRHEAPSNAASPVGEMLPRASRTVTKMAKTTVNRLISKISFTTDPRPATTSVPPCALVCFLANMRTRSPALLM